MDWDPAFVSAVGLRLRVGRRRARRAPRGRPLLLITGIGAHLEMWARFARLVDDRELIAFDPHESWILTLCVGMSGGIRDWIDGASRKV